MAEIYLKDKLGLTHGFSIAGDTPTATEMSRIDAILSGKPVQAQPVQTDWDNTGIMGAFWQGNLSGADQMQAGTGAILQDITGDQSWETYRQQQNKEANSNIHPEGGFFDQNGIYDKTKYLSYTLGQSTPAMAVGVPSAYAGGALGAGIGSLVAPGPGTLVGGVVGSISGLAASAFPQAYNENLETQVQEHGYIKDRNKAFKAAAVQSALEGTADRVTLGLFKAGGKAVPDIVKGVFSDAIQSGVKKAIARTAEGAAIDASSEAITEAAQQALTRWQAEKPLGDEQAQKEYIENAVVGFLLGAGTGTVAAGTGAIIDAKETAKKQQIRADIDAEAGTLFGSDILGNIATADDNLKKDAKKELLAEDTLQTSEVPKIEDRRPSTPLLSGPDVAINGSPVAAATEQGDLLPRQSDIPPKPDAVPPPGGRPPFSEEEYIKAVDASRGRKSFSADSIKNSLKISRGRADALFNAIVERGDGVVKSGKYPTIVERSVGPVEETVKSKVSRGYQVKELDDDLTSPYNVKLQGGRVVGPDFKTAEQAQDFAAKNNINDYVVTRTQTPKKYGVYEVTRVNDEKPTGRVFKRFDSEEEAKAYASSLNPDYSPKTNEKMVEVDQSERIAQRVNAILGRYEKNVQQLADTMLGKGKSAVDLISALTTPQGDGVHNGIVIEGQTRPDLASGLHRIQLAYGIYNNNMSPDERAKAIDSVAHHEILHVAKSAGLFAPKEWMALANRTKGKIRGKNYSYLERAQVRTEGAPEGAAIEEEAIAEMFRDYMRDPTAFEPASRNILQKLWDFIKSLGGLLKDGEDGGQIMEALASGKLAERGPVTKERIWGPYYSSVKIPGFYSRTADFFEKIAEKNPDQMHPGQQWLGMANNAVKTGAVSQEEMDWIGLPDWLKNQQKISVRSIMEYIGANAVDIQERIFDRPYNERQRAALNERIRAAEDANDAEELKRLQAEKDDLLRRATFHQNIVQRGGEDYQEFVFHMPHLQPEFSVAAHFDGFPNIIAFARVNTRTVDGKKTLFIEEMQSDLHQRGKKQGYASKSDLARMDELNRRNDEILNAQYALGSKAGRGPSLTQEEGDMAVALAKELEEVWAEMEALRKVIDIPDAPLKTKWSDFVIKRLVRHAAENNYDAIAWNAEPDGVAQTEQYGSLYPEEQEDGSYRFFTVSEQDVSGIVDFYTRRLAREVKGLFDKPEFGNAVPRIAEREQLNPENIEDLNFEFELFDDFDLALQGLAQENPNLTPYLEKALQIARNQRDFDPEEALRLARVPMGDFLEAYNGTYDRSLPAKGTDTDSKGNPNLARWVLDITPEIKSTALGKGFPMFSAVRLKPDPKTLENPNFQRWFRGSKVVGDDGKPLVLYHGTVKDFEAFGNAFPKGYVGSGIYFTDGPGEASQSYASVGSPDLLAKIELMAVQRMNELDAAGEDYKYNDIYDQVTKESRDHHGAVIPAFMALKRPFIMHGDNETQIDQGMRDRFFEASKAVARDLLNIFPDQIKRTFNNYYEPEELIGGADFRAAMTSSRGLVDAIDPLTGIESAPEAFRRVLEAMGFDGIIDRGAGRRWRMMPGVTGSETHYIAFQPTQIKSIYNNGNFSEEDNRILYSSLRLQPTYSATGAMGNRVPAQPPRDRIADIEAKITYNTVAPKIEKLLGKIVNKETATNIAEGSIIGLQDKYQPLAKLVDRVRKNGGAISNESDPYLREQLMHGEIDNAITKNERIYFDPLVNAVRHLSTTKKDVEELLARHPSSIATDARGLTREMSAVRNILGNYKDSKLGMAEVYLYAQHAKERNALMRERNQDIAADRMEQYSAGSGMTDAEADDVLRWFASKPFSREFSDLSNPNSIRTLFRKIIANTNDIRVAGQLNPDFRTMLRPDGTKVDRYEDYAPLRGYLEENPDHMNDELSNAFARAGKGMKIMGKEDFSATGRRDEAANIIGNAILQNMEAITRAGKNRVGLSFLNMLENNMGITLPSPGSVPNIMSDFAEIVPLTKKKATYSRKTGRVVMSEQSVKMDPNIMVVKRNGEEVGIKLNDPKLRRAFLGDAMLGTTGQNALIKGLLKLNRVLAAVRTSYNPEFMISNYMRDLEAAALNMTELEIKGLRTAIVKNSLPAARGVYRALREKNINDPYLIAFQDFSAHGGKTAFMGLKDLDSTISNFTQKLETDPDGKFQKSWEAVKAVGNFIDHVNDAVENGTRVAAYMELVKKFTQMSRDPVRDAERIKSRAAFIAKNMTVNFNMGGTQKPLMQALYLFYNASLQGTFALVNPLIRSKKVRAIWLTAIAGGVLQDALMNMISAVADDGESEYDKIPEQVLQTNIILPNPFVERGYFKIPMPYIFNAAWNAGRSFSRTVRGGYSVGEGMNSILGTVADAINPWGGGGTFLNYVAPTIMDPMVDLATNTNFMGSPISPPENPYASGTEIPSQKYWGNTSPIYTNIADLVDILSGGDKVLPGKMSFSPNQYEYIFEWMGGGAWSTIVRAFDMVNPVDGNIKKILTGDEVSTNDIPFVRRFTGNITTREDLTRYIENRDEVLAVRNALNEARKNGDNELYQSIMERYPEQYRIASRVNSIESRRRKIGAQINKIRENKNMDDAEKKRQIDALKEIQETLINQANATMGGI